MLVWELLICKVGLFETAFVVLMQLSVLLAVCHWQAPPPQEPMAEDQEEAVGPDHFFIFASFYCTSSPPFFTLHE